MGRAAGARKAVALLSAPKLRSCALSRILPSSAAAIPLETAATKRALPKSHLSRYAACPHYLLLPSHPAAAAAAAALFSTNSAPSPIPRDRREELESDEVEGGDSAAEWEEEEEAEPVIGDGGDGGGVALGEVEWGERALAVAREILQLHFGEDMVMFAFKVSPRGYIYVRLDKMTNKYGCPAFEEIENFSSLYKKQLDEIVESGEIPLDLALEVSSPGAERLLKVPEDLDRFKDMPMNVQYIEEDPSSKLQQQKEGVFMLELIDTETGHCVWKLADVKENRAESGKGRLLSRKQKDWRIQLPYEAMKRVTLYLTS